MRLDHAAIQLHSLQLGFAGHIVRPLSHATRAPAVESLRDAVGLAEPGSQILPGNSGSGDIQNRVDK